LVTDGLPSVDKNGNIGDADALLPGVKTEVQLLRATTVPGFSDTFDIQTFVLGFALSPGLGSKLDDIAAASLFYTIMGIPFALGLGAAFFFIIYRMVREPDPHGNICPYCGGYIVINPTNGEAYCSGCGKRF
jgi:hypothetical protein